MSARVPEPALAMPPPPEITPRNVELAAPAIVNTPPDPVEIVPPPLKVAIVSENVPMANAPLFVTFAASSIWLDASRATVPPESICKPPAASAFRPAVLLRFKVPAVTSVRPL